MKEFKVKVWAQTNRANSNSETTITLEQENAPTEEQLEEILNDFLWDIIEAGVEVIDE